MAFRVNDYVSGTVFLEGEELPLNNGNMLKILHIRAGVLDPVPVMHMEFVDALQIVPRLNLNDGSLIEIHIESTIKIVRRFRVSGWTRTSIGDGYAYTVDGYYDYPQFYMGTSLAGIQGTSYSALRDICTTCGIGFSSFNTPTIDSMLWLPVNNAYFKFARSIARYGYAGAKSHMMLAIDTTGVMRYRDVNANPKPKITLSHLPAGDDPNSLAIHDFTPIGRPGANNMIGGYGHMRYPQSAIKPYAKPIDQLTLDSDAKFPSVSMDVRTLIDRSFVTYSPIDAGNTHEYYEQARVQNIRYNLLNSMQGEFLIGFQTMFEAGDNFNHVAPAGLHNTQYDGEFTIATKIIFIAGSQYNEKLIAVKNGLNSIGT